MALSPAAAAQAAAPVVPASGLAELVARAKSHGPTIAAMQQRLEAARAQAAYAGMLEAPKLSVGMMDVPTFGGPTVALSRMFPGPGKLKLASEVAARSVDQAAAELEGERRMVEGEVKQTFADAVTMRRMRHIRERIGMQLTEVLNIASAKYATGLGLQQDALMVQLQQARLHRDLIENDRAIAAARARLNTLAARPIDAPTAVPDRQPGATVLPLEALLLARAEAHEPVLGAARAAQAAARSRLELARRNINVPNFDVSLQAGRTMPGDMSALGGMVGIDLPWLAGGRTQRMAEEANRMLGETEARVNARRFEVRARVRTLLLDISRVDHQLALYHNGLLPIANQSLAASLAAYQVNKADITTVLANQREIFETNMEQARALGDRAMSVAMLEVITGDLSATSTKGHP